MMEMIFYLSSILWMFGITVGDKFAREELGVSGRLRFTSGQYGYYNCSVVYKVLVSNLKIGIYIHDHTTSINYKINDTQSFSLAVSKVEDFYFARVTILSNINEVNRYVKLTATNENTGAFLGTTVLRVQSLGRFLFNNVFLTNNTNRLIKVFDDMFIGSVITKLWKQTSNEQLIFYLSKYQLKTMHAFSVTADGRLILSRRLNARKRSRYKFKVNVGYLHSSLHSSINVQINVVRGIRHLRDRSIKKSRHGIPLLRADTMPEFVHRLYNFSISELAAPSTIIGRLTEGQENVSFVISSGNLNNVFSIDKDNSILYISKGGKLNYEDIKFYVLIVNVKHNNLPSLATKLVVYLNVIDENDNSPIFKKLRYYVKVHQDIHINTTILKVHASDKDSGDNAAISYLLANPENTPFKILPDGSVKLHSKIDLKKMYYKYYLYIRAIDSGTPIRQETEVIAEIEITGANLHPPVMKQSSCHAIVHKAELNRCIVTFQAIDEDFNSKISYYLQTPVSGLFLNSSSGILTINKPINQTKIILNIIASDGLHNGTPVPVTMEVKLSRKIVHCTNNERYKEIKRIMVGRAIVNPSKKREISQLRKYYELNFFMSPGEILHIAEDAQVDTSLGVFKAGGSKSQCHTFVLYSIASGNDQHKFQIDLFNGTLYLYDKLEGHKVSRFKLEVKATDMYGNSVSKFINIKVDNINDTIPVFSKNGYYECNKTELRLGLCKVTAVVSGNHSSEMTYKISNGVKMFSIDFKTGVLSIRKSRYLLKENYIRVEASYGTKEVAHAVVHIVVTGGNINPPRCLSHQQRIEIATNTPAGTIVGRIFGYDIDDGKAGRITYSIVNRTSKFDAYFSLHSRTGLFKLKKGLTVKDKGYRFSVGVKLEDAGRPMLTATCQVFKIIVDAIGIYKPVFDHKVSPYIIHVSSNIATKAVIAEINAAVSTLSKINYQLVDGSGIGFFSVDTQVGKIIVLNSDFKKSFYWLTVQAYVETNPAEFTNAHLLIRIKHVKLKEPYFNPSVYHVTLQHDEVAEKKVLQLFASDGYQGFSADNVIFSIYSGDKFNHFGINRDGWLFTKKLIPVGSYALNMTVANRRNTSLISHGQVVVQISDENIKPLVFVGRNEDYIQVYESEGTTPPPFLFQCLAKDMNNNYGGEISYEILNTETPFKIDAKTAVVDIKKPHRLKKGQSLLIFVKATTREKKSVANMYNIEVIGRPVLKTELEFKKKSYHVLMNENSGSIFNFGGEVTRESYNPVFFYVISGDENLMFTFPPGSPSELVPVNDLDYERQTTYELGILAFDGRTLANTKLHIKLENLDDNPISASQPCFQAKVMENRKKVDPVITVQVTDLDYRHGGYLYEMMSGAQNKDFTVLNNGAISVKPGIIFDREVQAEHVVSVSAGIIRNAMTAFCVIVVIEDANDNKPNFTKPVYEKKVLDSVPPGTRIMAVYATDSDSGSNALLMYSLPFESQFFDIEETTGVIYVKKDLTQVSSEVISLDVVVQDSGSRSYKAYTKVKIKVDPDWNSFTFEKNLFVSSVKEKLKSGSLVSTGIKVNMSMVNYEIVKKNHGCYSLFWMDPFSGILLTTDVLDSEEHRNCTFVVNGILHGKLVTSADVFVQIEDENDNNPIFEKDKYFGSVLESQKSFTKLLDSDGKPLIIKANDFDAGVNGKIKYMFLENSASIYFTINENTGEVLTNRVLDYEKHPKRLEYHVKAIDQGFFALTNIVPLSIRLININDKRPEFVKRYIVSLFLPVYNGTFVEKVTALDDMSTDSTLIYSLDDPYGVFEINAISGEVVVRNPSLLTNSSVLNPKVTASDGMYSTDTVIHIKLLAYTLNPTFKFLYHIYNASMAENDGSVDVVKVVNPVGYSIGEKLLFKILNPSVFFEIGEVSGILKVKHGAVLDREHVGYYLVHVEASKVCDLNIIARTTINVKVTDINDNPPVFPVKKYFGAFDFDTKYGATLLKVSATDADEGDNAKIIYAIKSQEEEGYFSINGYSGEISLKKRFVKRHSRLRQNLVIQASDNGAPMLVSETTVEIVVLSKDQPMFTKTYEVAVSEDAREGHNLVKIEAKGRHNRQVYYEIMSGDDYEMFSIGFTSGELSVSGHLNYSSAQSYLLTLKAIDSLTGSWSEGECSIEILDINNNAPLFEKPFYDILVPEDTQVYTSILSVTATDDDDGTNAQIFYSLSSQSEDTTTLFDINSMTGVIILLSHLDAEVKSDYRLHVTGTDQGFPKKSSFTNVHITVGDVNDNPPFFLSDEYDFFADTYKMNDQFIGKVQAFDPDISDQVTYSLVKNSSYVRVDPLSGDMYLLTIPQHYIISSKVVVTDNKNKVIVHVNIKINTRNEERPLLREKPIGYIKEGSSSKKDFILNVQARQSEYKHNQVSYQIDSALAKNFFSISRSGDLFTVGKIFNREHISEFHIPIRATNRHGMFSLTDVLIKVLDANDHQPLFEFPSYESYVLTSQISVKSLLEVKAYDMDEGRNAELAYTTQGLAVRSTPIYMNKTTGLISLAGKPKGLRYQFSARVSDNGFPIWQSLADIQIAVKRWTDELVVFTKSSYNIKVYEDRPINSHLVTVKANLNNYYQDILYTFINGNLPHTKATHFKIHYTNGKISLTKHLDYEKVKKHKLMVRGATSTGSDSALCYVYIDVLNVNDNMPSFDSSVYKVHIAEDVQVGESIIRVSANDADDVNGNMLKYRIVSGSTELFTVNEDNGWVKINGSLDRETKATHELRIIASDIDNKYATCTLLINLIDINDCPPMFNSSRITLSVKEDELIKQIIGRVEAQDKDSTSNIQYFLKSTDSINIFTINNNGDISLLRKLTKQSYRLFVIAYDGVHRSTVVVDIKVMDVNNHVPVCLNSYYYVEVEENSARSQPLVQIKAEDADPSDRLRFIIQGDGIGKFHVNNQTGILTANSVLDHEADNTYHFKVVVADMMEHTCTSDVFIKLIDTNDNIPQFEQQIFFATVRENASQSVVLTQVKASDKDTLRNRKITYTLAHKYDPNLFTISPRGVITIDKSLPRERERIPNFSMVVTATDAGSPARRSSVRLQVLVLAVTDTPPKFEKLGYEFEVYENEPYGTLIGNIKVTTSSNLKDKTIEMKLINAAPGVFHLDNSGNLSINALLDYEMKQRYIFSVKAWFEMIPSLSSMVNVVVIIKDVNDHKPVFNQQTYFKQIDENVRAGTFVLQTYATDGDGTSENSHLSYRLISGETIPFVIEANTGNVRVSQSIDYETNNIYSFHVVAEDDGIPRLLSRVNVLINITDLNDNPPIISRNHSNVIVQEGTQPGSNLLELFITDIDSYANSAPFQCNLLNGDSRRFSVITGTRSNCIIQSKVYLDLRERDTYDLVVRVTDSGTPKQYSDSTVEVMIVQESHYAPVIQDPKLFFVIMSKPYVVTNIGEVIILDKDKKDIHQFQITAGNDEGIFSIQEMRGVIEGKPSKGIYNLSIEVTDGKYIDSGVFKIIVNELNEELSVKSIIVKFDVIDATTFLRDKIMKFIRKFAGICGSSFENVFIWSVQNVEGKNVERKKSRVKRSVMGGTVIVLAVLKMDGKTYLEVEDLKKYLEKSRLDFTDLGLFLNVESTDCRQQRCPDNQNCVVTVIPKESVSYNIPPGYMGFKNEEKCYCDDGTEGPVCYPRNSCLRNPCKFGQKCIQTESSYKCECIDSSKCDLGDKVKSFGGDSFLKYILKEAFDELFTSLSIRFKTESDANQILFYANGKDYFIVEIEHGFIHARFDFGSGVGSLPMNHMKVNNGNWHHIQIERIGNYVKLSLDDSFTKDRTAPGTTARININGHGIVFGAGLSDRGSVFKGFNGCLKQPKLGKKLLPFQGSDYIVKVEMHQVGSGCKDACALNTCPPFSDCINEITSYTCKCVPGHYGSLCQSSLTCADRPCRNNGVCTYTQINGGISYDCSCKTGFTGAQCHISLGVCMQSRCQNGATCVPDGDSPPKCICMAGYTGAKCEINENPCASKKCYYGGTCINLKDDFKCECPIGRKGKECASDHYCRFTDCQNGGLCKEQTDGANCICKEGFTGPRCQLDINECLMRPCQNDEICVNSFGSYYCNCSSGVQSKDCKLMLTSPKDEGFSLVFLVAGGLVLLIIVAVVIIAVICFRKRKHRYSHARTDDQHEIHKYPLDRYTYNDNMEMSSIFPTNPPPRGGLPPPDYFDDQMSAAAAMYDPSALTFSDPSLADDIEKVPPLKFTSRTSVECHSDDDDDEEIKSLPGYHWDYCEVPEDLNMKMSREGSRIGTHDQYYSDEQLEYVDLSNVPPQRPINRRSSMQGYSESETLIQEIPELPIQVRNSRQSLKTGNQSPNTARVPLDLESTTDYDNRYSLYDNENEEDTYIHDILENETGSDITTVTRPSRPYSHIYTADRSQSEGSELSDQDGFTETSLCSDEEYDDNHPSDPLDPENTRKLERDIKRLLKDLQKKTEED